MKNKKLCLKILSTILSIIMLLQVIPMTVYALTAQEIQEQAEIDGYSSNVSQQEKEPIILAEDINRRDKNNVKYFKMSDGTTKAAIYNDPVFYMNENGEWQEIDNSLEASEAKENDSSDFDGYKIKDNSFKVKFAKNSNQNKLVKIDIANYSMSFSYISDSKKKVSLKQDKQAKDESGFAATKSSQTVRYENISPDTDLEYRVIGSGVKENIIVKSPQDKYEYNFELAVKNLNLTLGEDGCIYATDSNTGAQVLTLPKPYMLDAQMNFSDAVRYEIQSKNDKQYIVSVIADTDWINEDGRQFPVIIDPGVQTKQSNAAIDSVYVASGHPNTNYWEAPMIMIGKDSSGIGKSQGLLRFTLPTLKRGDVVVDAVLSALQTYASAYSNTTPNTALEIHAVTSSWNKNTVTWNTKPTFESTSADFEVLKASQAGYNSIQRDWNVTSIVKRWYDGPTLANNGFLLRSSNENAQSSNDSCIYAWLYGEKYNQSTGYPILTITYRSNKGTESYWSYTNLSAGRAGTASICDFSGNLVFTHNDAATADNRAPVAVSHVYNNYMATETLGTFMPYRGRGWMLSCQQQVLPSSRFGLTSSSQSTYPYVYIDADGTEHYFYKKSDNTIVDEDGLGLTLTVNNSSTNEKFVVSDDNGNKMNFNNNGSLYSTIDKNDNSAHLVYSSTNTIDRLSQIYDVGGNTISFTPDPNNQVISKITDAAGRETRYNWSNGKLLTITYPDNKTTTFTYDSDNAMTSVTAPDGYKLEFTYTTLAKGKRVSSVVEKANGTTGQKITFDYSSYGTTVMRSSGKDGIYGNSDDIYTTTRFDSAGRTVSSESTCNGKSLGASSSEYTASSPNSTASNIKQLNRLSKSATGGSFTRNYLREGSADRTGYWTNAQWNGSASFEGGTSNLEQLYGRWSYRIKSNSLVSGAGARAYQTLSSGQFKAGQTYTFSTWVKTIDVVAQGSTKYGAQLMATYFLADNSSVDAFSEAICGTTDTAINNGWQRLSVTFTVPLNATNVRCNFMLRDSTGVAYFDGMQLEEGTSANKFNHIINASFEQYTQVTGTTRYLPDSWTGTALTAADYSDSAKYKDSTHSFKFGKSPMSAKDLSQDVYLGGKTAACSDDTYIVSGWIYGNPAGGTNEDNKISICAKVSYDNSTTYTNWFNFNNSVLGWQYVMGAFTLRDKNNATSTKKPTSIKIQLINHKQSNETWFDNIQLVRDEAPSYTYDSNGNLITVKANAEQNSSMEYSNNNLTKYVDAKGFQYTYQYDTKHNLTKATSQGGTIYEYTYDTSGNPTSLKVNGGGTLKIETNATYSYITNQQPKKFVLSTSDQDGYTEQYTYNSQNGTLISYTDKKNNTTNYTYNSQTNALTSVSQELMPGTTIQNTYTYEDDRLKTIGHNGFTYSFNYDVFGNTTSTKVGTQTLCTNTYGEYNGNLENVEYGNGDYVDYTYDEYGNISTLAQNGNVNFKWQYESSGNLYSHEDLVNNQKYYYTYDSTGRLVRQSVLNSNNKSAVYDAEYGYDLNNNVNRFSSLAGGTTLTETFAYGTDNLPTVYTYPSAKTATYTYDNLLRLNTSVINTNTPINHQYVYRTTAKQNSTDRTMKVGWEHFNDYIYGYLYDENGNITEVNRRHKTNEQTYSKQQKFTYDKLNRLIRADDIEKNWTQVYNYDNGGNILSVVTYPLTWGDLSGWAAMNTVNYAYTDTNWKDKLTSYNGQTITYDEIGNPLSYRGYTLTWQNGRQLATLNGNGKNVSYTYDVDGLRTSKTINGVKHDYYYIGDRLQYEKFGSNNLWFFYDSNGTPSGVKYNNSYYYFVCNWRGDVVKIYDSTGTLVANYTYDAWGAPTSITNANGNDITSSTHIANVNPIRYRGYYYDKETGFYSLQSRYYDPEIGRFINADTTDILTASPGALTDKNLFAYCDNNPTIRIDCGGDFWISISVVVGAVTGGAVNAIFAIAEGKTSDEIVVSTICGAAAGALSAVGLGAIGGAVTGLVDSAYGNIKDVRNGKLTVGQAIVSIASDTALSTAFGAMGSSNKLQILKDKNISKTAINGIKTAVNRVTGKTVHPIVMNIAKKSIKSSIRYSAKSLISNFISNVVTVAVSLGNSYLVKNVFGRGLR